MIVPERELVRVRRRCTQLVWPMTRGEQGERLPAPVEPRKCVRLQSRPFAKGLPITVQLVLPSTLGAMEQIDAERMGYRNVAEARRAWEASYGRADDATPVWAVLFVHGNHEEFHEAHQERYLNAKMGRYSFRGFSETSLQCNSCFRGGS